MGEKILSEKENEILLAQNSRLVDEYKALKLEKDAKKHWDIFYKRNETRFFKDRHWTTREFEELVEESDRRRVLFEIGCGVGNFIFPLIAANLNFYIYACDLSPRAIEMVKSNPQFDAEKIRAFQADVTTCSIFDNVEENSVDVATLIFVLSAIHPDKFVDCLTNIRRLLKPDGVILFRDYGLYDMAQLRFKAGHKISENLYMRQDGTRAYFFSAQEATDIFEAAGFQVTSSDYIHRRTVNIKENIDVPRIFVQLKATKT